MSETAARSDLMALANKINEAKPSWLPISGHVRNVTFTLTERDYECEGPDVAELLTEHEENLQKPSDPSPGPDVRRRVLDILNAVAPAVENLAGHQEQCDMDGVMVKVSRQALDEVLNAVNEVALVSALTRPLGGNIK